MKCQNPIDFHVFFRKQVYVKYHPLIGKLHIENSKNDHGFEKFECDVWRWIHFGATFMSLLKCVHMLIKIAQDRNIFVCDFVEGVKLAQHKLYRLYCDPYIRINDPTFDDFHAIEILINDVLPMS